VGWVVFIAVIAIVALTLLLREPVAEFRQRRRERAQARKREWRRQREAEKERRRVERAMNPAKAAAKKGAPRWQQIAERQGSKCWLCGTRTFPDDRRRVDVGDERLGATYPTVDYLVPIDRGGTYELDNVRIAHRHCRDLRVANPARTDFGTPRRTYGV
jgi:5-methylcytosine-specific restriction endonuclease McrA